MAEINFLPVCSNCKQIIHETIDYEEHADTYPSYTITPGVCPHCGERFDSITMPRRLPFKV